MAWTGRLLGLGGLVPFLAAALGAWLTEDGRWAFAGLLYGAIILSFLGGIQWGLVLGEGAEAPRGAARLGFSVAPSLIAWAALFTGPLLGPLILAAGVLLAWLFEQQPWLRERLPAWYGQLRHLLTAGVVLTMVALFAFSAQARF